MSGLRRWNAPSARGFRNSPRGTTLDLPGTYNKLRQVTARPPIGSPSIPYDAAHLIPGMLTRRGGPLAGRISSSDLPALPMRSGFNQGAWAKIEQQFWTRRDPITGGRVYIPITRRNVEQWVRKLHGLGVPRQSLEEVMNTFRRLGLY